MIAGSRLLLPLAMVVSLGAGSVSANEQVEPISLAELDEMGGERPTITSLPEAEGLEDLHARGIQGSVLIRAVTTTDGRVANPEVVTSSGSQELDEMALALFPLMEATTAKDADGNPVSVSFELPLQFWKDSITNLRDKSCADFVIDADWFWAANPDLEPNDMRVWNLTVGAMILAGNGDLADRFAESRIPEIEDVYEMCSERPSRKFLEAYRRSL